MENSLKRSIQALAIDKGDWIIITEVDLAVDEITKNLLAKIIVDKDAVRISPEQKDIVKIPIVDREKIMICWKVRQEKDQTALVKVSLMFGDELEQVISTSLPPKAASIK